jgi:hypothetical protein
MPVKDTLAGFKLRNKPYFMFWYVRFKKEQFNGAGVRTY